MRKFILLSLLVPGLLAGLQVQTQAQKKFEGIATYQSSLNIESINIGGDRDMTPEMRESVRKQLAQQSQRNYTLAFNVEEASWKLEAALDPVSNASTQGGPRIRFSAGGGLSYLNPSKNLFLEETEIFGKKFLIEDELPEFTWKITSETRKIGDYQAIKAEFFRVSEQTTLSLNGDEQATETVMDTTIITAWYTPEIPVSQGPANSWGLPGLILELKNGNMTYLCTKVELNPDNPVKIEIPSKGKKVTQEEAQQIQEEKMQEMMKKYDNGDGGSMRIIRSGG